MASPSRHSFSHTSITQTSMNSLYGFVKMSSFLHVWLTESHQGRQMLFVKMLKEGFRVMVTTPSRQRSTGSGSSKIISPPTFQTSPKLVLLSRRTLSHTKRLRFVSSMEVIHPSPISVHSRGTVRLMKS